MIRKTQTELEVCGFEMNIDNAEARISEMLNIAIEELSEIGAESDIWLVDNGKICRTYEQIYSCLKHRAQRRLDK